MTSLSQSVLHYHPSRLDTRSSRRFAEGPGVATCLPGDGSARRRPCRFWTRALGAKPSCTAPELARVLAIDRHNRCHPAFPPARWCITCPAGQVFDARGQVKVSHPGTAIPDKPARHFGDQKAEVGEAWRVPPIHLIEAASPMASPPPSRRNSPWLGQTRPECPQIVGSVAGQHVHGGDQLASRCPRRWPPCAR